MWPILVGTLYFLLAAASLFLTRSGHGIATIWPPSGLMLATLLTVSRSSAPRYIAAGAIGSLLANLTMGVSATLAVGFTVANMTESVLAAWLLQRQEGCRLSFINPAGIRCFCMASGLAASVSAALATSVSPAPATDLYLSWFATDLLGMLIVAPIIIIGVELHRHSDEGLGVRQWPEVVAVLGAVAVVSAVVFAQTSYPLLFLPMVGVLVAVFRLGPFGAAASVLTVALACSVSIRLEHGPTALIAAGPERIFFMQFYLLVLMAAALPVAALLATRNRLLAELVASNQQLASANGTLQHFAAVAAHDLVNPLTSIGMMMQLVQADRETTLSPRASSHVANAGHMIGGMSNQVQALLTMCKVHGGRALERDATDLEAVVDRVALGLSSLFEATGADLTCGSLPIVDCQPVLVEALFQNLVENSVKYRSDDKPVIHISHRLRGARHVFSVTDNGIGMSKADGERAFGLGGQLDGKSSGAGLGLSMCKSIVELHGGSLWIDDAPDQGSCISFTLAHAA